MKAYLKKNGIKVFVPLLVIVILVLTARYVTAGQAGFFANAAKAVGAPIEKAATAATRWTESLYGYIYAYDMLLAENEVLKQQLAEEREQNRLIGEALIENELLRSVLGLMEKHSDFVVEAAKITAWSSSNWSSSFTINKGSNHGLELGDCVVNESFALVGQISELGDTWSTVRTVIDVELNVGVLVGEAGNAAMVVGDFTLMNRGKTKLTYLTEGTQLLEGEEVLTSGKGGVFPQGLLIGRIVSVETDGRFEYGVIEPECNLSRLSQVIIIKDFYVAR